MSLFKTSWQMLEVLLQLSPLVWYLPYLRAFQWGTLWPYASRVIKNWISQIWKVKNYLLDLNFQLWLVVSLKLLEVQGHTVPFWKALEYDRYQARVLCCCSTSSICQDVLKSTGLLNEQGFVDSLMHTIVCVFIQYTYWIYVKLCWVIYCTT